MRHVEVTYIPKIKQLLQIISESAPFVPNVSKLSERMGINRNTLLNYLNYLHEVRLTNNLYKRLHLPAGRQEGISKFQKPDKLYLENPNIIYALAPELAKKGNLRETFMVNQLSFGHDVAFASQGDLSVDNRYTIEVGGKSKSNRQIDSLSDAFIAADDIEFGIGNKIPLWLFGFLY